MILHVTDKSPCTKPQMPPRKMLIATPLPSCYLLISLSLGIMCLPLHNVGLYIGTPCQHVKGVSPKISRVGQQKRNNGFFLIWPKEPFGELFSETVSKGSISFFFPQNLQNLKIRPQGHQWRPWGLKFGTCLTWSYGRTERSLKMSFTQRLSHLLSFTRN